MWELIKLLLVREKEQHGTSMVQGRDGGSDCLKSQLAVAKLIRPPNVEEVTQEFTKQYQFIKRKRPPVTQAPAQQDPTTTAAAAPDSIQTPDNTPAPTAADTPSGPPTGQAEAAIISPEPKIESGAEKVQPVPDEPIPKAAEKVPEVRPVAAEAVPEQISVTIADAPGTIPESDVESTGDRNVVEPVQPPAEPVTPDKKEVVVTDTPSADAEPRPEVDRLTLPEEVAEKPAKNEPSAEATENVPETVSKTEVIDEMVKETFDELEMGFIEPAQENVEPDPSDEPWFKPKPAAGFEADLFIDVLPTVIKRKRKLNKSGGNGNGNGNGNGSSKDDEFPAKSDDSGNGSSDWSNGEPEARVPPENFVDSDSGTEQTFVKPRLVDIGVQTDIFGLGTSWSPCSCPCHQNK